MHTVADGLTDEQELVDRALTRRGEQGERLDAYTRYLDAIFNTRKGKVQQVVGSYADGRPALRLATAVQENWSARDPINLLPSIVDSFVSLRGTLPSVRVLPENGEDEAIKVAEKRSRGLREQYSHSKLNHSFKRAAFHLVAQGDVCFTLDPWLKKDQKEHNDKRPVGVYISVMDPANAFPEFRFGVPGDELEDLFIIWNLRPEVIKSSYKVDVLERTDVITYYSRTEKQVLVAAKSGPVRITGVTHDLGFCPAQWVTNKATDGRFAQSDIRTSIELHEQLGIVYNILLDALMWAVWPVIHEEGVVSTMEVGPGATVETTPGGKFELLAPEGNVAPALQLVNQLTDMLSQASGSAPIQTQGPPDRANISGRALDRGQGPMEQRMVFQNDILGDALEALNEHVLTMLSELPGLKNEPMPMYGQEGTGQNAKTYADTFTGSDIGGWTRNEVKWDPLLGSSRHERLVQALQLHKESGGLFPISHAIREFGEDDPQQVLQEGLTEAKMLMQAQQQAQPQQPGQPQGSPGPPGGPQGGGPAPQGVTDQAQEGAGMMQGGLPANAAGNPAAQPQGPSQPQPTDTQQPSLGGLPPFPPSPSQPGQPGMGSPAPMPDVVGQISQVLDQLLPDLHGSATLSFDNSGPEVLASDQRDIPRLRQALTEVWGTVFGPGTRPRVRLAPQQGK